VTRPLEGDAKRALANHGVAVPDGEICGSEADARRVAEQLGGPVAVKALVAANRRARAGGVIIAADADAAERAARTLLRAPLLGHAVRSVLVERAVTIRRELYFAIVLAATAGGPIALATVDGGVDIEEQIAGGAGLARRPLDPWGRDIEVELAHLWREAGLVGADLPAVVVQSSAVARAALALDATLLEINPLALTDDGPVAVGVLLEVDDDAGFRQGWIPADPDWSPMIGRPPTSRELAARAVADADPFRGTARFVELPEGGDIGLVTGGGGASLVLFDAVQRAGGRPACYTEIGGNPTAEKVRGLTGVVLSCPGVRGLLVAHNLTSNTQIDLIAEGVVAALADAGLDAANFPVVAREAGTNDRAGRATLEAAGIEALDEHVSLEAAAARIVERVAGAPS
jgi:succinyl-CoA synthetase beta subunit/citryl-CoA synthetase large subunit